MIRNVLKYVLGKVVNIQKHGCIAQWLERLTADQQVPGSTPGAPFFINFLITFGNGHDHLAQLISPP